MAEVYSKEFITEFIELYRQQTCLWKMKDVNYRNKAARDCAYKVLVNYSKRFYPYANKDFVVRKVQSLRSSFRKEVSKYLLFRGQNPDPNAKYEPSLWYFYLLMFTKEQDVSSSEKSDSDDSEVGKKHEKANIKKEHTREDYTIEISENSDSSSSRSEPSTKRKRKRPVIPKQMPLPQQKKMQFEVMVSEYDSVGINVAAKLKRMDPHQAPLAELLINKVLALGLLRRLTANTDVSVVTKKLYDEQDDINLHREVNLSD